MTKLTRAEAAEFLARRDHIAILTHGRPDGDTLGSAAALCLGLRQLGKTAHVLHNPEAATRFPGLLEGLTKEEAEEGDCLVSVDVASPGMLPDCFKQYLGRIDLRIDHHGSATSFTEYELVDPLSAACAEIVYDILCARGVRLDEQMGKALYIAVSTDTGCFRYANTTAHSYRVAAACADTGADLHPITQALFDTNSLSKLHLQSWIVHNAEFLAEGRAAICVIPLELENSVSKDDMETISGFLRSIEGIKMSAIVRSTDTGSKMSVRAIPGYDAATVCARFGGGGHKGAAGASLDVPPTEAAQLLKPLLITAVS